MCKITLYLKRKIKDRRKRNSRILTVVKDFLMKDSGTIEN